jgi:hypothetical protein
MNHEHFGVSVLDLNIFFLFFNIFSGDRVKYVRDSAVSEADQRLLLHVVFLILFSVP